MSDYDLIVIGAGSGNMIFTPEVAHLRAAIVESDRFGGTCLNHGCIPSKMYVVAAEVAETVANAGRLGVNATLDGVDWPAVRDRIFGRIDPKHEKAIARRRDEGIDVVLGHATFVGPKEIEVDGVRLSADRFVVATGSRPIIPDIEGLDQVEFHTSDTIMRLDALPASVVILGGGYVAAEFGHVFAAFGTAVTIVTPGPRLVMREDAQISERFTECFGARVALQLGAQPASIRAIDDGVEVVSTTKDGSVTARGEILLVAVGREPQTDVLGVEAAGIELDEHGHIKKDDSFRTSVPGIWAFGDAANHFQLKHLANAEMRVVAYNIANPDAPIELAQRPVPHAVFSSPQIAGVGLTEEETMQQNLDVVIACRPYSDTAYGWAMEDTTSFVKVIADRESRLLLGAHIIGPNAALLLHPLVQGMMLGQTVDQLAREVIYVHPALIEVVEQALLAL